MLTDDPFAEIDAAPVRVPVQRNAPSPAQVKFAVDLLGRKFGLSEAEATAKVEPLERKAVSEMIDYLKSLPNRPAAPAAGAVTEDGMYRNPETGEIFKVQRAVHGSGNLYAKILVVDQAWERDADGKVVVEGEAHFEYAPGAIKTLRADWKMTRDEAIKYGALYGVCVRCGKTLTLEQSIERAMGKTCFGKF